MTQPANDESTVAPIRIGVYIDGGFWFRLFYYWLHHHWMSRRLALDGVQDAARWYARTVFDRPVEQIIIDQSHHFQALRDPVPGGFAKVLDRLHITHHGLPFDQRKARAVGVEVELALTCWEQAYAAGLDMVMLVTGNDDYRPLVERLVGDNVRVLVPQIDVTFTDGRSLRPRWLVTSPHLCEAATDTPTWDDLIGATLAQDYALTSALLRADSTGRTPSRTPA